MPQRLFLFVMTSSTMGSVPRALWRGSEFKNDAENVVLGKLVFLKQFITGTGMMQVMGNTPGFQKEN